MERLEGRGRDRGFPRPPERIRAGRITALGSYLEFERRNDPRAKDDRCVRSAAIDRHVEPAGPKSDAYSGFAAEATETIDASPRFGSGISRECWSEPRSTCSSRGEPNPTNPLERTTVDVDGVVAPPSSLQVWLGGVCSWCAGPTGISRPGPFRKCA